MAETENQKYHALRGKRLGLVSKHPLLETARRPLQGFAAMSQTNQTFYATDGLTQYDAQPPKLMWEWYKPMFE